MSDEKLTSEQRSDLVNYYFERAHDPLQKQNICVMIF